MPLSFPGVINPHTFSAVVLRGAAPSRILGLAAWQQNVTGGYGTVAASVGNGAISFPGAATVAAHLRQGMERFQNPVLSVAYEDRRWKWRYASVSGHFNERMPDNTIRYSPTHSKFRRSARELFQYVLRACGDSNADVSAAPASVYPPCHWQDVPCDQALDWLCQTTWCSLVLVPQTNVVKVVRRAAGGPLADLPSKKHISTNVRIGAVPDAVAIGCGPTRFQSKLRLEAVGLDEEYSIKRIADLSYKPTNGWADQWPGVFPDVAPGLRHLASRTVWRWYRVAGQANGGLDIPEFTYEVVSPDQYRLLPWLVDTGTNPDELPIVNPAYIQGSYYPQWDAEGNSDTVDYVPSPFTIIPS